MENRQLIKRYLIKVGRKSGKIPKKTDTFIGCKRDKFLGWIFLKFYQDNVQQHVTRKERKKYYIGQRRGKNR